MEGSCTRLAEPRSARARSQPTQSIQTHRPCRSHRPDPTSQVLSPPSRMLPTRLRQWAPPQTQEPLRAPSRRCDCLLKGMPASEVSWRGAQGAHDSRAGAGVSRPTSATDRRRRIRGTPATRDPMGCRAFARVAAHGTARTSRRLVRPRVPRFLGRVDDGAGGADGARTPTSKQMRMRMRTRTPTPHDAAGGSARTRTAPVRSVGRLRAQGLTHGRGPTRNPRLRSPREPSPGALPRSANAHAGARRHLLRPPLLR